MFDLVTYEPGMKLVTDTPYFSSSTRIPSLQDSRALLVAPYTARPGKFAKAQWLATVMIRPKIINSELKKLLPKIDFNIAVLVIRK